MFAIYFFYVTEVIKPFKKYENASFFWLMSLILSTDMGNDPLSPHQIHVEHNYGSQTQLKQEKQKQYLEQVQYTIQQSYLTGAHTKSIEKKSVTFTQP